MHDRPDDRLEHSLALCRNSAVPEAQDAKILRLQELRALFIVVGAFHVLAAIQFDDQPAFQTGEVRYVVTDWNLSSEARAWNLSAPKILPQAPLRLGHDLA
jgi:hypothetical protein